MGLFQLIQFFGGSISVAICGILLAFQKDIPLPDAYRHVYGFLFLTAVFSLGMLVWYQRSIEKEKRKAVKEIA